MTIKLLGSGVLLISLAFGPLACSESDSLADLGSISGTASMLSLEVYKSPTCGCCNKWISHLEDNSFEVAHHNQSNLSAFKAEQGIAPRYQSCHTAVSSDGYVFEGHIPAKLIRQFLRDKPAGSIGLAAPGMPAGSPGMEMGQRFDPYAVLLLKADGSAEVYAQITLQKEQY